MFLDCLVKNDTVKGIIGKTQGVNKANKPPMNPKTKMLTKPFELSESVLVASFKSALFFKSNFNFWVSCLLRSSIETVSLIAFPVNEMVKSSSTFIQAVSQTCPKKLSFIFVIDLFVS